MLTDAALQVVAVVVAFTAAISPMNVFPDDVGEKTIRLSAPNSPSSFTARS